MREFKFIRGIYKDENIFNSDETNEGLFACDKNGENIRFDVKNDKSFQDKIVRLSSDEQVSNIYVIRPDQVIIKGEKISDGSYSYEYSLKDETFDHLKDLSDDAKTNVASYLKNKTTGTYSGVPNISLKGDENAQKTNVDFSFIDDYKSHSFSRELYFRVTGKLTQVTYETANGNGIDAYKDVNSMIGDPTIKGGTFKNGKKQDKVDSEKMTVAQKMFEVTTNNYNKLKVASNYEAPDKHFFRCGTSGSKTEITYNEIVNQGKDLYLIHQENNTELKCTVPSLDGRTIVKGYSKSYENLMTFSGGILQNVGESHLIYETHIDVYPSGSHIFSGGVYKDSSDGTIYYKLNDKDTDIDIDSTNATINENGGEVSPINGGDNVFRQINEGTLKIEATES